MLDLFHIAKPQNCDIQIFYGNQGVSSSASKYAWSKPRGVSNVYMMVIGAGGTGASANGGGSGAVSVWYGSAQNVPDNLMVSPGRRAVTSYVYYYSSTGWVPLVTAESASGPSGGVATAANFFSASGFYQSIAGASGSSLAISASATTFLSGGGAFGNNQTSNYGYSSGPVNTNRDGFFQMQPIIVGAGGMGSGTGDIGCGGGVSGVGGRGMVLIASW